MAREIQIIFNALANDLGWVIFISVTAAILAAKLISAILQRLVRLYFPE